MSHWPAFSWVYSKILRCCALKSIVALVKKCKRMLQCFRDCNESEKEKRLINWIRKVWLIFYKQTDRLCSLLTRELEDRCIVLSEKLFLWCLIIIMIVYDFLKVWWWYLCGLERQVEKKVQGYVMCYWPRENCIMPVRFLGEHKIWLLFAFLITVSVVLHYSLQSHVVFSRNLLTAWCRLPLFSE